MEVTEELDGHVLRLKGDLTIFEAAEFRDALLTLFKHEGSLELDVSGAEQVDSSGIQLMMAASHDGRMVITGMTDSVQKKIAGIGCAHLVKNHEK